MQGSRAEVLPGSVVDHTTEFVDRGAACAGAGIASEQSFAARKKESDARLTTHSTRRADADSFMLERAALVECFTRR